MFDKIIYTFGSPSDQIYGRLVLSEDGSVFGYDHPNERTWNLDDDGVLWFYHQDGYPTASFMKHSDNVWLGHKYQERWPLFLIPVLKNITNVSRSAFFPPVFINTLPKSGTYFLEAAFKYLGWEPLRWHLGGVDIVDDYSQLSDSEIHVAPQKSRLSCPLTLVPKIIQKHQLLVGHVANCAVEEAFLQNGFLIISCVRNLRDVLVSLFRFKLNKVGVLDQHDQVWRLLPDSDKFLGFLLYYRDKDISFLIEMTNFLITYSKAILLRYENVESGVVPETESRRLNLVDAHLSTNMSRAFLAIKNQVNPTYSGTRSKWQTYWSDAAEVFFRSYLYDLNTRLGYET